MYKYRHNIKVRTRAATRITVITKILIDESDQMSSKISVDIKRSIKEFIVLSLIMQLIFLEFLNVISGHSVT